MAVRGRGNWLERLGPDLSTAIFLRLEDPVDLVRSASVSHSWRRFVIENGFCKNLCLRMYPEISCFVRAIEVGVSSDNMEAGSNFPVQWLMLQSEHKIYAYLGYCTISPRFLTGTISSTADRIENMVSNKIGLDMFSYRIASTGYSKQTFELNSKFCVVHKIKIQPEAEITPNSVVNKSLTLRFRLGHMMDEKANCEKFLDDLYIWTYVSPIISITEFVNVLPRHVICINGILQIEVVPGDRLTSITSIRKIEAMGSPLAPAFDASIPDGMGNSVLMYFPSVLGNRRRSSYYRNKPINAGKRRRNRWW